MGLRLCLLVTSESPISKPTPLYGQPSWWGEDEDPDNKPENIGGKQPDQESTGQRKHFLLAESMFLLLHHDT